MVNQNFTLTRGDSLQFRINFLNTESLPHNIIMTIKDKSSDTTSVLQLQIGDGITKVDDADSYDVYIASTATAELELLNYIYQIATLYGSDYETIVEGKLVITPEV